MSAFQQALDSLPKAAGPARKVPPARTLELYPEHFAETWESRPVAPITIGLRVPSERDYQGSRIEAEKTARGAAVEDEERPAVFNDALFCGVVATAICSPHDVTAAHPFLEMAEDVIPVALKPRTIRWLFDSVEKLHIDQSPGFTEATDEEVAELAAWLSTDEPFGGVRLPQALQARRYLKFALDILTR